MTRDAMIEKLREADKWASGATGLTTAEHERLQAAAAHIRAVLAVLSTSVPAVHLSSLVALHSEWKAAISAPGYRGDTEDAESGNRADFRREALATAALLAWTPAQAEPAAPRDSELVVSGLGNIAQVVDALKAAGYTVSPLPASIPAEMP